VQLGGWQGLLRVEASVAVDVAARRARSSASASGGEEDVTTGIWHDEGEPGVEAGSEEATCRQRTMKESVKMLQTEEKTKECDSGGELGDMGVVAGGGAESQDQEVRAQRGRRELGEEERRHRRGTCVSCCKCSFGLNISDFLARARHGRATSAGMTHARPSGRHRERYDRLRIPPSGDAHPVADVASGLGRTRCSQLLLQARVGAVGGGETSGLSTR